MTKSTITRERLQEIAEDGLLKHGESKELARMALVAMDSEPDRNPVLAYADSYRDMAKQGVESVPIWSVITDLERNIAPLYRHAQHPVVPEEMTAEQAYEIGDYHGDPVDVFLRGANWMRQHIIDSTLAAAPQSTGIEPAAVPGKWIPVSEQMPEIRKGFLDTTVIIAFDGDSEGSEALYCIDGKFRWGRDEDHIANVTHWMPMPSAPQEDEK